VQELVLRRDRDQDARIDQQDGLAKLLGSPIQARASSCVLRPLAWVRIADNRCVLPVE
jgi:hypothetical protein